MKIIRLVNITLLFLFFSAPLLGQGIFSFPAGVNQQKISVDIVNNLIIIPVTINNVELKFILDTGANGTIIFQIPEDQELLANNAVYIDLKGAGGGEPIKAIKSEGNTIKIGDAVSFDETMFVIVDEEHDFSLRLGFAIQGIIGYEFFKDFIVEVNYKKKFIKIHRPLSYLYKKCKKCSTQNIFFYRNRPLIQATVTVTNQEYKPMLLLDSGASDTLWLFEDEKNKGKVPELYFEDFLGLGLNGVIKGKRAYSKSLSIGPFEFYKVTTAFPDSISIRNLKVNKLRNGSIGAGFLHRFNCVIDYPNQKLTLSKNRNYNKPFNYNKSGITVQHGEYTIAKELLSSNDKNISRASEYTTQVINMFKTHNYYRSKLQPTYEIAEVRPNSQAEKSGIQKGDLIITINNRSTERMKLDDINNYFFQEDGKIIKLKLKRNGIEYVASITLKSII